jgi:hypothetical protein
MTSEHTSHNYAVGSNMPGYLTSGDVWITSDYRSAREALKADIESAATSNYEVDVERFEYEEVDNEVQSFFDLLDCTPEVEFNGFEFEFDGYVYWMAETDESPDEEV